jgi:hypothetical protein
MQTKKHSLIESITNVLSGLLISWLAWHLIISPIFKIYPNNTDIVLISVIFTILSIIRSYFIRRIFNHALRESVNN